MVNRLMGELERYIWARRASETDELARLSRLQVGSLMPPESRISDEEKALCARLFRDPHQDEDEMDRRWKGARHQWPDFLKPYSFINTFHPNGDKEDDLDHDQNFLIADAMNAGGFVMFGTPNSDPAPWYGFHLIGCPGVVPDFLDKVGKEEYSLTPDYAVRRTHCFPLAPAYALEVVGLFLARASLPIGQGGMGKRCRCQDVARLSLVRWQLDFKKGLPLKLLFGPNQSRVAVQILESGVPWINRFPRSLFVPVDAPKDQVLRLTETALAGMQVALEDGRPRSGRPLLPPCPPPEQFGMEGIRGCVLPPELVRLSRPKRGQTASRVVSAMSDQLQLHRQARCYEVHPVGLVIPDWVSLYDRFRARRSAELDEQWRGCDLGYPDTGGHGIAMERLLGHQVDCGVSPARLFFDITLWTAAMARVVDGSLLSPLAWMDAIRHAGVPPRSPVTQPDLRGDNDKCMSIVGRWFARDKSLCAGYSPSPAELEKRARADAHFAFMFQRWHFLKLESRQMQVSGWLGIDPDPGTVTGSN
jgi:hypothetical protein